MSWVVGRDLSADAREAGFCDFLLASHYALLATFEP